VTEEAERNDRGSCGIRGPFPIQDIFWKWNKKNFLLCIKQGEIKKNVRNSGRKNISGIY
jgi:hypothetical protein